MHSSFSKTFGKTFVITTKTFKKFQKLRKALLYDKKGSAFLIYNESMRKEYEQSGLPDLPNPNLPAVREEQKKVMADIKKREENTGRELEVVVDKRPDIKLPVRVAYQQDKVDLGKLPLWYLQALGSMTMEEYNEFMTKYSKELTINELIASDFIAKVLNKDAVAVERFWRLQEKLLNKPQIIQQVNIGQVKPDAVMSDLLDAIGEKLNIAPPGNSETTPK